MTCYKPITGFRSRIPNASGKRSIVFSVTEGYADLPVTLPCGRCIGCRLEYSRQWAIRCFHEASLHEQNCFITLTYSEPNLPEGGTLVLEHFQKFMKRLRKKYPHKKIRFFHCGEYGDLNYRPHYHACIFNHSFDDQQPFQKTNNVMLYISEQLQSLWPYGFASVGDVTFESAAYVARYIMKKVNGGPATGYYTNLTVDETTGELLSTNPIKPEYVTMSRRPGIASGWFEKYKTDVYPDDFIVIDNKKMRPPKFYDNLYENLHSEHYEQIKYDRIQNSESISSRRLDDMHQCKLASISNLPRNI